jgi:hypothetical protein
MSVGQLIQKFATRESLPIDVNDVVAELRERGIKDEIYFFPADLNSEVLRGKIVQWEWPKDETQQEMVAVADIYYDQSLDDPWQRLVTCKEMLHILDPDSCLTATEDEVDLLTDRIVLPPELQDPIADGDATITDRIAIFQAVAVLFPLACRELFMPAFEAGKITSADIARFADIPQRYATLVMSAGWVDIHKVLVTL